jgi:hypothetical protein
VRSPSCRAGGCGTEERVCKREREHEYECGGTHAHTRKAAKREQVVARSGMQHAPGNDTQVAHMARMWHTWHEGGTHGTKVAHVTHTACMVRMTRRRHTWHVGLMGQALPYLCSSAEEREVCRFQHPDQQHVQPCWGNVFDRECVQKIGHEEHLPRARGACGRCARGG